MTEEEKKEFEEFLQWKAERAKAKESDNKLKESEDATVNNENSSKQMTPEVNRNVPESPEIKGNTGNAVLIMIMAFVAVIFLVFMVIAFTRSNNTQSTFQNEEENIVVEKVDNKYVEDPVEKARKDSIARAKRAARIAEVKKTIKITSAYLGRPNSASGVDAYFYYKNLSDKTIKYLVWEGYPMNAVGDRVNCEIRGYQDYRGKHTGPVKPGKKGGGCWSCAWYNSTAKKLILTGIDIEYMDGSTFTIKESEIEYVR